MSRIEMIQSVAPDILILQGIDYDLRGETLAAFNDLIGRGVYQSAFAGQPNSGYDTGLDVDGNGKMGEARDAMGYGRFAGHGGMAVLSKFDILTADIQDLSSLLWKDVPDANLPFFRDGRAFPSQAVHDIHRLSTTAHWIVPIALPGGAELSVMTFHATPPVFDGDEDQNGKRNGDEIALWQQVLDGKVARAPKGPFVIAGLANLDPVRGQGLHGTIKSLMSDERLQDPAPIGVSGDTATARLGDDWLLRLSYVLPSRDIKPGASGVELADAVEDDAVASRHGIVWLDMEID